MSTFPINLTPQTREGISAELLVSALKLRLAVHVAPVRWKAGLESIAQDLEEGNSLESSIEKRQSRLPRELTCLLRESLALQDPAGFLSDSLRIRRSVRASWNRFRNLATYPLGLLLLATAVGVAFSFCVREMTDLSWIEEYGLASIPPIEEFLEDQHQSMVSFGLLVGWIVFVLLTIYLVGPAWGWLAVLGGVVVIGKPLRWLSLQEILQRYQLFLSYGLPLGEASHAVSRSFHYSGQSIVCRSISRRIEAGSTLGQALASSMLSDGICRPSLYLMDARSDDLPRALDDNAKLLAELVDRRCQSLQTLLPLIILVVVGGIVWHALATYLLGILPLVYLIQSMLWFF